MAKGRRVAARESDESEADLEVTQHYAVSLPHNRTAVVEASSEDEAYRKYKEVMGIRSSDHEPSIAPCDPDDYIVDEHGVELPNKGVTPQDDADNDESQA